MGRSRRGDRRGSSRVRIRSRDQDREDRRCTKEKLWKNVHCSKFIPLSAFSTFYFNDLASALDHRFPNGFAACPRGSPPRACFNTNSPFPGTNVAILGGHERVSP